MMPITAQTGKNSSVCVEDSNSNDETNNLHAFTDNRLPRKTSKEIITREAAGVITPRIRFPEIAAISLVVTKSLR